MDGKVQSAERSRTTYRTHPSMCQTEHANTGKCGTAVRPKNMIVGTQSNWGAMKINPRWGVPACLHLAIPAVYFVENYEQWVASQAVVWPCPHPHVGTTLEGSSRLRGMYRSVPPVHMT